MTAKQQAKLKMYKAVVALCRRYPAIVSLFLIFKDAVDKLASIIALIDAAWQEQKQTTTGITTDKDLLKAKLCQIAADVAAGLYVWAVSKEDSKVQAKANLQEYELTAIKDEELGTVCQNLYELAVIQKADIDSLGVTQDVLDDLEKAITNFDAAVPDPRLAIVDRKAAGKTIAGLFKKGDELLKGTMDKTMRLLKRSNPDFVNRFKVARKIVNPPTTHTALHGVVDNKLTGEPVNNALIEIVELQVQVHANENGEYSTGKILHGTYTVRISADGFATQVIENVKVKLGEINHLDIELLPIATQLEAVA